MVRSHTVFTAILHTSVIARSATVKKLGGTGSFLRYYTATYLMKKFPILTESECT